MEEQVHDIADLTEQRAIEEGEFDPATVEEQIELAADAHARRYAYLLGLDRAFAIVHPATDAVDKGRLTRVATRYYTKRQLNTRAEPGSLLPRWAKPARLSIMDENPTKDIADLFENVTVVSPETCENAIRGRVPRSNDLPASVRTEGMLVGCAPVARRADVKISESADALRRYYHVEPVRTEELERRIAAIVAQLDAQGVELAVMPELTLSPSLLERWIDVLRAPPPRGTRLRLLLVGTGPFGRDAKGRTANRAVLLTRAGEVLLTQDKRHGFNLSDARVERWGLRESLPTPGGHAEPLRPTKKVSMLESSVGRFAIMVCEDLGQLTRDWRGMAELGPSTVLAPVLSQPTLLHYWEHSDAKRWASDVGADTIVANSLVIADSMRAAGTLDEGELGTALAHGAEGAYVAGHADQPDEIVAFRFTPEGPTRAVLIDRED